MLLAKGAESNIYLEDLDGRQVIAKRRLAKPYRVGRLDEAIRARRTSHEAKLLHDSKLAGVSSPTVFLVSVPEATLVIEYLGQNRLKESLITLSVRQRRQIWVQLGEMVGRLHSAGIVHGDLTTSNVLLVNSKPFMIDFGLGEYTRELESQGVDLLILNRALKSSHFGAHRESFDGFLRGYRKIAGASLTSKVLQKMSEIEARGRYSERF